MLQNNNVTEYTIRLELTETIINKNMIFKKETKLSYSKIIENFQEQIEYKTFGTNNSRQHFISDNIN